jgi:hypothetical protein
MLNNNFLLDFVSRIRKISEQEASRQRFPKGHIGPNEKNCLTNHESSIP